MASVNTSISSSLMTFNFRDEDDTVVASFKMNPADVKLAKRCEELAAYFEKLHEALPVQHSMDDLVKLNDEMEEKICYLLGYNARQSLFGMISATSIMADGKMFVVTVVDVITENIAPVVKQRVEAMAAAVEKHTAKYE